MSKTVRSFTLMLLLLVLLSGDCFTQSRQRTGEKARYGVLKPRAEAALMMRMQHMARVESALPLPPGIDFVFNPTMEEPIEVRPCGLRFSSLQAALDHCAAGGNEKSGARDTTVVINPNTTVVGNFTLPTTGVKVIGLGGSFSVAIIGASGVPAPTFSYTPSGGGDKSYAWFEGLWIAGRQVAAIDYTATDAWASLWIRNCNIETSSQIPAILAVGSGFGSGQPMSLSLDFVGIESTGTGVLFDVNQYVNVMFLDSYVSGETTGVDIMSSSQTETDFRFLDSGVWGEVAMRVDGPRFLWLGESYVDGNTQALIMNLVSDAVLERGEFHSETGNTIEVSGSDVGVQYTRIGTNGAGAVALSLANNSRGNIAFCDFGSDLLTNAIVVDGTSTKKSIYNHWNFDPLP